jgi:hypothetical protein
MEAEQRRQAGPISNSSRAAQHRIRGVLAVDPVDDQLRDHRVVEPLISEPATTPESTRTPGPDGSR